jgi:hypothetical protein
MSPADPAAADEPPEELPPPVTRTLAAALPSPERMERMWRAIARAMHEPHPPDEDVA